MIDFNFEGIEISASAEMVPLEYTDHADKKRKMRLDKVTRVSADFWDFRIYRTNNLYGLATIQATLQFFVQSYWKRSSKDGAKIDLADVLEGEPFGFDDLSLCFSARQRSKEYFLQICLKQGEKTLNEVYLNVRQVAALDKALGKAISLLSPKLIDHDYGYL